MAQPGVDCSRAPQATVRWSPPLHRTALVVLLLLMMGLTLNAGHAASLGGLNARTLGTGSAAMLACDCDGVRASYTRKRATGMPTLEVKF